MEKCHDFYQRIYEKISYSFSNCFGHIMLLEYQSKSRFIFRVNSAFICWDLGWTKTERLGGLCILLYDPLMS